MKMNSGTVGYCEHIGSTRGLVIEWDDNTITDYDCEHKTCGCSSICEILKDLPIGFTQTYPAKKTEDL